MSAYKKQTLQALEQAEQRRAGQRAVCFDASKPLEERLHAFGQIGSILDEELFARALALVDDAGADARLRAVALEKIAYLIGNDESLLDNVISMLNDRRLPDELRLSALKVLQSNSFSSPIFPAKRPAYLGALRALVDDENRHLREAAIDFLALNKDEYVQRRLIEGLESPEKQITQPELAVVYLGYDLHADHFPILRKLAMNPPNEQTRREALRNLAADSDSRGLLQATLANRNEDPEVRHICAVALQNLDPASFRAEAGRIVEDSSENEQLKVSLLNTMLHTPGSDTERVTADLNRLMEPSMREDTRAGARKLFRLVEPKKGHK
jgi:HEAT repeat protein